MLMAVNDLYPAHQSDYRKQHSTEIADPKFLWERRALYLLQQYAISGFGWIHTEYVYPYLEDLFICTTPAA